MTTRAPAEVRGTVVADGEASQKAQRLRLRRFVLALYTYGVVILATALISRLGLGALSATQWALFIGLGAAGNAVFLTMIFTNMNLRLADPSLTMAQIVFSAFWGLVPLYALPEARPIILMFYLPSFSFGMLRLTRGQYLKLAATVFAIYASVPVVEYSQGRPGFNVQYELFLAVLFGILLIWIALYGGFVSDLRRSMREKSRKIKEAHEKIEIEIAERRQAQIEKDSLIVELRNALGEVRTLSGLLPICASCKNIRDDKGYWKEIELYIRERSGAEFTHGLCPKCAKKLYPDLYEEDDAEYTAT